MSFRDVLDDMQSDLGSMLGEKCHVHCGGVLFTETPDGDPIHVQIAEDQLLLNDLGSRQNSDQHTTIATLARKDIPGFEPDRDTLITIKDPTSPMDETTFRVKRPLSSSFQAFKFTVDETADLP